MRVHLLSLAAALAPFALADVQFTKPAAGSTQSVGSLSIAWKESGDNTPIDDLQSYQIFLMYGGNTPDTMLQLAAVVTQGDFSTGNQAEGTITAGLADSTKNAYFLKMISVATEGGQVINYSNRFSISGMTGTAAATYKDAVPGGTDGPDGEDNAANNADSGAATSAMGTGDGVPYPLQTGLTKYAPMQPIPPTKITKKQYSPLYPTSAVTIATTWLPNPTIVTTVTASQTFSVSSMENTAAPASNPNPDMAKFLNRWKD
ncbi:hypothetical protein KC363_g8341 [Hortaea werneckii]|uniref:Uncharacterized protein n=1 Tax=Hortaea werneckii TaxID=91943 RepID=A0A3M7EY54_HORWE|nr:hypothetical protein KC361_g7130 [Hortaea werneckii]KAI6880922.1 hypothetical protein KC325_g6869 [Hortaea werneckii]KAI7000520.1 hypothetical protein KC359_g1131 [Hortaea werneckii]KAI7139901.1 hypothetical protein KC344_g9078 [Hortaea werneckii]KAI7170391.1 hypothetical protein KC360_g6857 [Hortaea werneckii]